MEKSRLITVLFLLGLIHIALAAESTKPPAYIPTPKPAKTQILVGAHNCPLWEAGSPEMWNQVLKNPERTPTLGFYDQSSPEVADWETKRAVEHGISFFVYCWYRASKGDAVETRFGSAINTAPAKVPAAR